MDKSRILIIEDEPLIARDLKRIVTKCGYVVAGICYNSDKALDTLAKNSYDIILLDIHLQGSKNGIELAQIVNQKYRKPFIFITSFADRDTIERVKITEPAGYIVKPFNEKEVYSAIEIASYRSLSELKKEEQLSIERVNTIASKPITDKEFEIIQGIIQGRTNSQLASIHFVSENTIKSHIKNIYRKLDAHSKAEMTKIVLSYKEY